jgi:hypothetical protein
LILVQGPVVQKLAATTALEALEVPLVLRSPH